MKLIRELFQDESGMILSAEAVTVGTVGVLGAIVGLSAAGKSVNGELTEMASAIRSLDQSYGYVGHRSRNAWTAGSCYIQPDVQQSIAELSADGDADIKSIQKRVEEERNSRLKPAAKPPVVSEPQPTPLPNQLPGSDSKKADESNKEKEGAKDKEQPKESAKAA